MSREVAAMKTARESQPGKGLTSLDRDEFMTGDDHATKENCGLGMIKVETG